MCVQGVCRFDYGREGRVCPNCRAKAEGVFQVTYLPQMKTPTPTRLTQDMLFNRYKFAIPRSTRLSLFSIGSVAGVRTLSSAATHVRVP
jgi:hypothetical protein